MTNKLICDFCGEELESNNFHLKHEKWSFWNGERCEIKDFCSLKCVLSFVKKIEILDLEEQKVLEDEV